MNENNKTIKIGQHNITVKDILDIVMCESMHPTQYYAINVYTRYEQFFILYNEDKERRDSDYYAAINLLTNK